MAERAQVSLHSGVDKPAPRWARNLFVGAAIGLVIGIGIVYVLAFVYGETLGLTVGKCAAFACTMTVFLSQPAGIVGMVGGAAAGAAVGGVAHWLHRA